MGRPQTEATKKKISQNNFWRGKKRVWSAGMIRQISESSKKRTDNKGANSRFWIDGRYQSAEYVNWHKNQRSKIKKINGGNHTFGEWQNLKAQYDHTCPGCGKSEPTIKLTQDHIIPLSRGGSDNIENIQPLCLTCNIRKHTKIIKY